MNGIFLSIIVPVYNAGSFLPECIDSIAAADIGNAEVIFIDDGSTDGSAALCEERIAGCPNMRLIRMKNSGPSAARNRGIDEAAGEYISFIDSDDYIDPAAFRRSALCLNGRTDADILASDFRRVSDNGCVLDRVFQIDDSPEPIEDAGYMAKFLAAGDCVWNVWRYIFRKQFLLDKGLRFEEGVDCAEDLQFSVRALMSAEKTVFFHNPYYFYRVNYGNTLTRKYTLDRVRDLLDMLQSTAAYLKGIDSAESRSLQNKIAREFFLNLSLIWQVPDSDRREAERMMREAEWLLKLGEGAFARAADAVVSLLGLKAASGVVMSAKTVKRRLRGMKTALHGMG